MIAFTVYGLPEPAGSKRAFVIKGRAIVTDANAKSRGWKNQVTAAAREAYQGPLLDGPLSVTMTFFRPRPAGHMGANGKLKKSAPSEPTTRPDVLKLARAVEDALTGVIWRDDAQITQETIWKRYGEPAMVVVEVRGR